MIVVRRGTDKCPSSSSSYPAIKLISESSESKLVSKSDNLEDIVFFLQLQRLSRPNRMNFSARNAFADRRLRIA